MTKTLTISQMLGNVALATDNDTDYAWFSERVEYYMEHKGYDAKIKRIFVDTAYESLMIRIALETIPDKTERAVFYIENGIVYETAKTIEEAILPLLEKHKEDK